MGNNETTYLRPDSLLGEFTKASDSRISETTSGPDSLIGEFMNANESRMSETKCEVAYFMSTLAAIQHVITATNDKRVKK